MIMRLRATLPAVPGGFFQMCSVVAVAAMTWVGGATAQSADDPMFSDNYPQLVWRGMSPDLVFGFAFRSLGLDLSSASQREKIAWRVWRGVDPDKPMPADSPEEKAAYRERWRQVDNLVDELEKVFAVAAADLPGTPRELAEQAWLGIHGLAQEDFLPTRAQWLNEINDRVEQYALGRMLSALDVSEEQQHAIEQGHERFLEVHRVFLDQAYDTFDEKRAELDEQLARQPLFRRGPDDPPLTERRDQIRVAAFQRTYRPGGDGRIAPTAYAEDLLGELMTAFVELRQAAERSRQASFNTFQEQLRTVLTDEQSAALPEAHNAYEIGRIVASGGANAASAVSLVSPRFDVRVLIDPNVESLRAMPQEIVELREALDDLAAVNAGVYGQVRALVAAYEANWLAADEQMRQAEPRVSPLQMLAYEIEWPRGGFKLFEQQLDRDARSLAESVALQNDIAQLLMRDTALHQRWIDVTNRQIHRLLYSRWPALDIEDEFDAAIADARAVAPSDPKLVEALRDLRGIYLAERDAIEQRLIEASLRMGEMACWYRPAGGSTLSAKWEHRQSMDHAVTRRDWYRNQIQLLTIGDG